MVEGSLVLLQNLEYLSNLLRNTSTLLVNLGLMLVFLIGFAICFFRLAGFIFAAVAGTLGFVNCLTFFLLDRVLLLVDLGARKRGDFLDPDLSTTGVVVDINII